MDKLDIVGVILASGLGSGVTVWGLLRFILSDLRDSVRDTRKRLDSHLEWHSSK